MAKTTTEGSEDYFKYLTPGGESEPSRPFEGSEDYFSNLVPKAAPEVQTRWSKLPAMIGQTAVGTVQNLAGLPGDIWAGANKLMPAPKPGQPSPNIVIPQNKLWTGTDIAGKTGMGLSQHPELAPKTGTEKMAVATTAGAVGALPMLLTDGAAAPTLLSGALGGAAEEATNQLAPGSKVLPVLAGLAAGTGVQGAESLFAGNRIEKIANTFGQSRTIQDAGTALQDAARNWRSNVMPAKQAVLSAPLDARVPLDAPVKLSNYKGILDDINNRAGDLQASADVLTPAGAKRLQRALSLRDEANALVGKAEGEPTTWENARALRSLIGEAKSDPMLVKDVGKKNMDALYSGITQDLGNTADLLGAKGLWDTYNTESTKLYKFAEDKLSKIISTDDVRLESMKPEDVASKLLAGAKKGSTDLDAIKAELPNAVDELTAANLRSPTSWKTLSPEAKRALVPDEAVRKELDRRMPIATNALTTTQNLLSLGIGSQIGEHAVPLLMKGLGSTVGSGTAADIGHILGIASPLLYHGGKAVVQNPRLMRGPIAGVAGAEGSNALSLDKN